MTILYLFVLICCLSYTINKGWPWNFSENSALDELLWHVPEGTIFIAILPILVLVGLRWMTAWKPEVFSPTVRKTKWPQYGDWLFLLGAALFWLIKPLTAHLVLLLTAWAGMQLTALLRAHARKEGIPVTQSMNIIALLFFCSGFSAVIYQIVWQRTLFAIFGSDVESVTIIVSVFMFGLGVGAAMGNTLLNFRNHLLQIFFVIELFIGLFGLFSLSIAHHIQLIFGIENHWLLVLAAYALFAFPTLLMGATLPVLVAYLNQRYQNIGRSSGFLYAMNTWGSAFAAFLAVVVIFSLTGLQAATWIAAILNLFTAAAIYFIAPRLRGTEGTYHSAAAEASGTNMSFRMALLLSFLIGFITLSQELVWYRLLGLTSGSDPRIFGLLLACMLLGIGSGSYRIKQSCESGKSIRPIIISALFIAGFLSFLTVPLVSLASGISSRGFGVLVGFALAGTIAYFTGGVLPALGTLCATTNPDQNSRRLGWIYALNILGATLGPLATGYILFDLWPFEVSSALLAAALLLMTPALSKQKKALLYRVSASVILFAASYSWMSSGALERIQLERLDAPAFTRRIDNHASVITAIEAPGGAIIYGGGAYNGSINTDPAVSSNGIDRAYIIPVLHPAPGEILEIGLSSGAWAAVMSTYDGLEQLNSVEINPGYLQLISTLPTVAPILHNTRVMLEIDDGRRWLRHNPERQFDVIVMNTIQHWRSQATNLLSKEFFQLCKKHLADRGVIYFNNTESEDATFTAAQVFKYIVQYDSFTAASDHPFDLSVPERRNNLLRFKAPDGSPYFLETPERQHWLQKLSEIKLPDVGENFRQREDLGIITDDNMRTEFKL